eukprot:jgi/Botrbrau1/3557/Bobra.0078s0014.1
MSWSEAASRPRSEDWPGHRPRGPAGVKRPGPPEGRASRSHSIWVLAWTHRLP